MSKTALLTEEELQEFSALGRRRSSDGSPAGKPKVAPVDDGVSAHALHCHLRQQVEKRRASRELPVYMFFLLTVTAVPWMSRLSNTRYNELYHLEQANRLELDIQAFEAIRSRDSFWEWIEKTVEAIWIDRGNVTGDSRLTSASNFPLGHVVMRQFRVKSTTCAHPGVLTKETQERIPPTCSPEWDTSVVSTAPFGPNSEWLPNSMLKSGVNVAAASTMFHDYTDPDMAFPVLLPLHDNITTVMQQLAGLRKGVWIDGATRVVLVDVMTFNPSIEAFALNHLFVEFFATGSVVAGMHAYPFELMHFDTVARRVMFVCDIFIALVVAYIGVSFFHSVRLRKKLGYTAPYVGLWDLYDIPYVIVHIQFVVMRMWLWRYGPELHDPASYDPNQDELSMFITLFKYGYHFEECNTSTGVAVVFAWMRLFRYMQHHHSLGVMSATMRRARSDLASLVVIFTVLILGFGVAGAALYGVDHQSFSSWSVAMGYLLRLLISGEVNEHYNELRNIQPVLTGWYISIFMLATWLLALNMVLAVLNGAFFSVLEERQRMEQADVTRHDDKGTLRARCARTISTIKDDVTCVGPGYCRVRMRAMGVLREFVERKASSQGRQVKASSISRVAQDVASTLIGSKLDRSTMLSPADWVDGTGGMFTQPYAMRIFDKAKLGSGSKMEGSLRLEKLTQETRAEVRELAKRLRQQSAPPEREDTAGRSDSALSPVRAMSDSSPMPLRRRSAPSDGPRPPPSPITDSASPPAASRSRGAATPLTAPPPVWSASAPVQRTAHRLPLPPRLPAGGSTTRPPPRADGGFSGSLSFSSPGQATGRARRAMAVSPAEPLPEGWRKGEDGSGRGFYYNRETGARQWSHPSSSTNEASDLLLPERTSSLRWLGVEQGTPPAPSPRSSPPRREPV
eukprot:TRINITY_DN3340_c3_g1_i1.p1 TRINITY_DN3340_c3_g1~~TRINITY_DN3340_c3_g1_i1.p1  ORF type:complete len:928 (+),score=263.07 TRINITY_DN3340_c3_g1_i1:62-2785(+)